MITIEKTIENNKLKFYKEKWILCERYLHLDLIETRYRL
jgi:hypothetical protein